MTTTLGSYVVQYLGARRRRGELADRTVKGYRSTLLRFADWFGQRPLDRLTPLAIDRWAETIGCHKATTRRRMTTHVAGFCRWMVREGIIASDPTADREPIREPELPPRALDVDQVATLLDALPDVRARAIVWLMVGCGLRCVEVSRLNVEHWSRRDRLVRVTGKGGHQRDVPVPSTVARALDAYLAASPATSGPMVRSLYGPHDRLCPSYLSMLVSRWMHEAGIKHAAGDGISAHACRHTAASDVADRCHDPRIVQAMLGHKSLMTTQRYLRRAALDQMREAMEGRDYRAAA
jgi:site-specific recombinase XerD